MQSPEVLSIFITPLTDCGVPYFVTGSIASIFYGEPRLTHDIDIVIHLSQHEISRFVTYFPLKDFYCPPDEVIQIESKRRPFGHFNLIHHASGLKADIYPDVQDPLHQWAFKNRRQIAIQKDLSIWIAPPEYVIIRKLEYYREGGSDKHLEDIRKMLNQDCKDYDFNFLKNEIKIRELKRVWEKL